MSDTLLTGLTSSPDVYLQKLDLVRDAALLVRLSEGEYRASSFLDDRILTQKTEGAWAPLARVLDAASSVQRARPVHFIFHSGHVGSTLLSRLLDETQVVLSLREPLPLRTLAEAQDVLGRAEAPLGDAQFDVLVRTLLAIWSRGYDATHSVLVKATSSASRAALALLSRSPSSRAVFLNVAPEVYLATLLAGKNSPADLRGHGPVRIRQLEARLRGGIQPLHSLSLGELAAMGWLAETWNEADMASAVGERVLSLDFDALLVDLQSTLQRVLTQFELPIDDVFLASVARSPVLTRYSKAAEFAYSPQVRARVLDDSRRQNADEIRRGLDWLERLASASPEVAQLLSRREK